MPFDEVSSTGSVANAHALLTGAWEPQRLTEFRRNYPSAYQWSTVLARSVMATTVAALSALVDSGMVTILDETDWATAALPTKAERNRALVSVARQLMTLPSSDGPVVKQHLARVPDTGVEIEARKLLLERVFAVRPEMRIANPDKRDMFGTGRVFDDPVLGEIVSQCTSNLSDLVSGLKHWDAEAQRLVLGTALTNAKPGQDLDVHLGSNLV